MELNYVSAGIMLIGTTVKKLIIENNIVDVEQDAKRSFGLNINEPYFHRADGELYAQMVIDIEVEIQQSEEQACKLRFSLEGVFLAGEETDEENFKELVVLNGAAALISIARGKIEAVTGNIFNAGKIVIPFVNVIDYYKSLAD